MGMSAAFAEKKNVAAGIAAIPFIFIFNGFYDIAWTPLSYAYSSKILTYNVRSKGLAISVSFQNISNAFNNYVNPIALASITWRY